MQSMQSGLHANVHLIKPIYIQLVAEDRHINSHYRLRYIPLTVRLKNLVEHQDKFTHAYMIYSINNKMLISVRKCDTKLF